MACYTLAVDLVLAVLLAVAGAGADDRASELLEEARSHFSMAEFERALERLDEAEARAESPKLRARIFAERGVIEDAMGSRVEATLTFVRALMVDRGLRLDEGRVRAATRDIFGCARNLAASGWTIHQIRERMADALATTAWSCPAQAPVAEPEPPPRPEIVAAPPPEPRADPAFRWGMVGGGVAVAAGGLALDLALDSGRDGELEAVDFVGASLMVVGAVMATLGIFAAPEIELQSVGR